MDLSDYVKEFRGLQKTQKIRVADYCRKHILDYYEMVETLKRGVRGTGTLIHLNHSSIIVNRE